MKIPVRPPAFGELWTRYLDGLAQRSLFPDVFTDVLTEVRPGPAPDGKYRHWDTFRHTPTLAGVAPEDVWLVMKLARRALYRPLPLTDLDGRPFQYALPNTALEMLHGIDRDAAGAIRGDSTLAEATGPAARDTYLFKSLVEEAITSSQLEGASTTRRVAKAMLQEGRAPRDRSERMIYNNYQGMLFVRRVLDQPLTPAAVLELQRILTEGTLDEADAAGRLRRSDEPIVVSDEIGQVLHVPPPADQLPARLAAMCEFANGAGGEFMPPAVRAIVLHFWLAYDHPFVDGNGRTARALFYWATARQGYWLCEFVSISRILKRARAQYARAFLYTETDDNDVTYFLLYQLRVLRHAIDELHAYLARHTAQLREAEALVRRASLAHADFNPRQLALVNHALKRPGTSYTVESHRVSHGVSYETSRSDLLALARAGLVEQRKRGRAFVFVAPDDLRVRLAARAGRGAAGASA